MLSSTGQSSRSRERTRDRWVPKFLWIPEHSMHIKAPRFRLAQSGSAGEKIRNYYYLNLNRRFHFFHLGRNPNYTNFILIIKALNLDLLRWISNVLHYSIFLFFVLFLKYTMVKDRTRFIHHGLNLEANMEISLDAGPVKVARFWLWPSSSKFYTVTVVVVFLMFHGLITFFFLLIIK